MLNKISKSILFICVLLLYSIFIGCPLKKLFNFSCPFCGMTRANLAFLQGNIQKAYHYHKLFFLGVPCLISISLLCSKILKNKWHKINVVFLISSISIIFINFILEIIC
jgi:hypothetical protein